MVNLISNGDFEAPGSDPADWTITNSPGSILVATEFGSRRLIFNGGNSAPTGAISQMVTGAPVGETVTFSFDYRERGTNTTPDPAVRVRITDNNGTVVLDAIVTNPAQSLNPRTFTFTSTTNDYTVEFIDVSVGTNSRDALIDNVVFDVPFVVCFVAGTPILTPSGYVRVEDLKTGDHVVTRDNGPKAIRWIGKSHVRGQGDLSPVLLSQAFTGSDTPLLVSPNHRVLVTGERSSLLLGDDEVLAAAEYLIDNKTIRRVPMMAVSYYHILLETHELMCTAGAWSESFHPGEVGLSWLESHALEELQKVIPEIVENPSLVGPTVRRCIRRNEASVLLAS